MHIHTHTLSCYAAHFLKCLSVCIHKKTSYARRLRRGVLSFGVGFLNFVFTAEHDHFTLVWQPLCRINEQTPFCPFIGDWQVHE